MVPGAVRLMIDLIRAGVRLSVDAGRLSYDGPADSLGVDGRCGGRGWFCVM